MKISFHRESFLSAFQTAAMVSPRTSPKAILQNVKLDVGDKGAMLLASDMETGIRIRLNELEVETPGRALLSVNQVGRVLRETSDDRLEMEVYDNVIFVRGSRSEFQFAAINPDEFPTVDEFSDSTYMEVSAKMFKDMIRRTVFATDMESSRFALSGVKLEFEEGRITSIGTDGRRLARMHGAAKSVNNQHEIDTTTIVPARSMNLLERAIGEFDGELQIAARSNDVLVKTPDVTIYSRLVEGRFPRWREVFPDRTNGVEISATVGPVLANLRQASIVANDDSRGIDFQFGNGTLVMSGVTAEIGQARVEMPISYEGEPITVTLDHRYISDFLRVLNPDSTFQVEIVDSDSAAVFSTEDGFGYVVMPLSRDQ